MKNCFLIINYNDYETTNKLIENIKEYKLLDKILIVDNNSSDDSYLKLKKLENEKIEVIRNDSNKGYGSGINFGSKYLINLFRKCYIIVSNPDIIIYSEDVINRLINSFDEETAIVAPIIKEHEGLNRGWIIPSPIQDSILNIIYIHRILRPRILLYKDNYFNDIVDVEAVSGCFFIINSQYLEEINYFDENIFLYYEENVIAKKLQKINKKIKLNCNCKVFHNHSVTIDKNIKKIKKYKELKKSQMYFQKKYNKANILEIFMLYVTNKLTLVLLYISNIFRKSE